MPADAGRRLVALGVTAIALMTVPTLSGLQAPFEAGDPDSPVSRN